MCVTGGMDEPLARMYMEFYLCTEIHFSHCDFVLFFQGWTDFELKDVDDSDVNVLSNSGTYWQSDSSLTFARHFCQRCMQTSSSLHESEKLLFTVYEVLF